MRRMGYGPLPEPKSDCTTVAANCVLHPCFPHPIRPFAPPSPLRGEGGAQPSLGRSTSNARRELGEATSAGDNVVELGKLLVAPMIAAIRNQLARRVELLARFRQEARCLGRVGKAGGRGLGSTRPFSGAKASRRASESRARSRAQSQK